MTPQVIYPRYLSDPAVSFISALLRHDVDERLGCGPGGKENIMSHKFFAGERMGKRQNI